MRGGPRVLGIVLAGGEGKRLAPLTQDRAKPAVPFGGNYRLIDFVLSNLVNGEIRQIAVLSQFMRHRLDSHVTELLWRSELRGNLMTPLPVEQGLVRGLYICSVYWYEEKSDVIY